MRHDRLHDAERLGITVMTQLDRWDLEKMDEHILVAAARKVADGIAAEILKKHKGALVRRVMANPDLLRQCNIAALSEAEKIVRSRES